jgi:hypothetical protein
VAGGNCVDTGAGTTAAVPVGGRDGAGAGAGVGAGFAGAGAGAEVDFGRGTVFGGFPPHPVRIAVMARYEANRRVNS